MQALTDRRVRDQGTPLVSGTRLNPMANFALGALWVLSITAC